MNGKDIRPSAREVLCREFLEHRAHLLEVSAFLDRIDRYRDAELAREDLRYRAITDMIRVLVGPARFSRTAEILELLSDSTLESCADEIPTGKAIGVWRNYDR